jgi:hypothetical protein
MRTCDLYVTIKKLKPMHYKKVKHDKNYSSYEAEVASASNVAVEILKSSLQATG